jgi:enoyl-CoA hydratase/carnithine racemase
MVHASVATAAASDLRLCDATASFGIPAAKLGIAYAPAGVACLVELIGVSGAAWLLLSGDPLTAKEARAAGFVHQIVDDLDSAAVDLTSALTVSARFPCARCWKG